MGLIAWDKRLETGYPKIDEQHKTLIDACNNLHQAMKQGRGAAEIQKTMLFLKDYTIKHFSMEKGLMTTQGYPDATRHLALHDGFVGRLEDLSQQAATAQSAATLKVMDFLTNWLVDHIQVEDVRLAKFLNEKA